MAIDIPFNYDPVENKETTTSYTVPAGKYALVTATLSVSATGKVENNVGVGITPDSKMAVSSDSNSVSVTLKLLEGAVLTKSESPASASDTSSTTDTRWVFAEDTSNASLLVDAVEVSEIDCSAFAGCFDNESTSNANVKATITGTAKVHWHIAEYNSIN